MTDDPATGARIGVPAKLVPQQSQIVGSGTPLGVIARRDAGRDLPHHAARHHARRRVRADEKGARRPQAEYSVFKPDFFVISGLQDLKKFYVRAQLRGTEVRGITVLYDQAMDGIMEPVVVAMSSAYAPFSDSPPSAAAAAQGRVRERGRDRAGLCRHQPRGAGWLLRRHVAGIGGADRVADDKASGLALLRVYGCAISSRSRSPARTRKARPDAGRHRRSAGAGRRQRASSAAKARVSDTLILDPAPALGFDGAAALDAQGRLAGMRRLKAPVVAASAPGTRDECRADAARRDPRFSRRTEDRLRIRHGDGRRGREGVRGAGDLRAEVSLPPPREAGRAVPSEARRVRANYRARPLIRLASSALADLLPAHGEKERRSLSVLELRRPLLDERRHAFLLIVAWRTARGRCAARSGCLRRASSRTRG